MDLQFRPAAANDVEEAYFWYESQSTGLGERFLAAVDGMLSRITEHPAQFAVVHRRTRRARLDRFPYALFYQTTDNLVLVFACMHGSRDPRRWMSREP